MAEETKVEVNTGEVTKEALDELTKQVADLVKMNEDAKKEKEELAKKLEESEAKKKTEDDIANKLPNTGNVNEEINTLKEVVTQMLKMKAEEDDARKEKEAQKFAKAKKEFSEKFNIPTEKLANVSTFDELDKVRDIVSVTTDSSYLADKLKGMGYNDIPIFTQQSAKKTNDLKDLSYKDMVKRLGGSNTAEKDKNDVKNLFASFTGKSITK